MQSDKRWYKTTNITIAEKRFNKHLEKLRKQEEQAKKERQK